jgi:hypothetical protein
MRGRTWRLGVAIVGAAAAFGGFSGTALAEAPSCSLGFTDPAGDAKDSRLQVVNNAALDPLALPGQDNEDLLGGAVTSALDGTVTVTMKLANMSNTVPTDANGVSYYYGYTIDGVGTAEFVSVTNDGTAYRYDYGHVDPRTGTYLTDGSTSGSVVDGANGTVSIVIPDSFTGDTLDETYATVFQDTAVGNPDVVEFSSLNPIDSAPDGGGEGGANNAPCAVTAPTA